MFAKTIIDSDAFIDMPLSTQALYFHLSMRADDDGFINNPKKIQRMISASDDDLKMLIVKKYILPFDSGVVVIKHWKIHNYIRSDRYKPTVYTDEKALITSKENGVYTKTNTVGIPNGYQTDTQVSIDKVSISKDSIDRADKKKSGAFVPPTLEEVSKYCQERENTIDPQTFIDFYEARGWMVGNTKMKNWKAAVRTWENRKKKNAESSIATYDRSANDLLLSAIDN